MTIVDYGEFTFKGSNEEPAKYIRVTKDTEPSELYDMMRKEWQLRVPDLLISVAGSANDFPMKPKLKDHITRGLVEAAKTTGGWIITGGIHAGFMKHVGEAVRKFSRNNSKDVYQEVTLIGIAPWEVCNQEILSSSEVIVNADPTNAEQQVVADQPELANTPLMGPEGSSQLELSPLTKRPAACRMEEDKQGRQCRLDHNHQFFILVGDGSRGEYGVETELRTHLEKFISEQTVTGDDNSTIPVVCVALGGGEDALNIIHESMTNGIPCVIVEGSGRIADVIAQVAHLDASQITTSLIKGKLCSLFQSLSEEESLSWNEQIQNIARMSDLLSIVKKDTDDAEGLDEVILKALLKGYESRGSKNWDYQLYMSMCWKKRHIAEEILAMEWQEKRKDLCPVMTVVLVRDRPDFVELLLDHGVDLREFVTLKSLTILFKNMKIPSLLDSGLRKLLENAETAPNLNDFQGIIAGIMKTLLGSYTETLPPHMTSIDPEHKGIDEPDFIDVNLEYCIWYLIIWSLLQNRGELAEVLWSKSQNSILGALVCCKILKNLADKEEDEDTLENIEAHADRFENLAIGVLSECCEESKDMSEELLTRVSTVSGKTTCLQMAVNADCLNFMSHGGVQRLLTKVWWGNLSPDNGLIQVLLCMLCFPLIFTGLVKFRKDISTKNKTEKPPGCCQRLTGFFTAPVVVFYWNVIAYMGLLCLFAYVVMMDFQVVPSWREYLLYVWMFTLFCEEVRQPFHNQEGTGCWKTLKFYIADFWNVMDVAALLLFLAGVIFRFTQPTFYLGRVTLSLDFGIFCFRLMQIFEASKTLGPQIIMMREMIKDAFSFLFLLAVWIVSFGVSNQAILVHNEERLGWIFWNVIYQPYLTLFGEIGFAINGQTIDDNTCSLNGTDPDMPKCPYNDGTGNRVYTQWLTIILISLYLLLANLMLINLLIALFSSTFGKVQDNTDQIWRFQRHNLIKEYCSRPHAPPPFNLFSYLCLLVKCCKSCQSIEDMIPLVKTTGEYTTKYLILTEAFNRDKYLRKKQDEKHQRADQKAQETSKKVDKLLKLREEGIKNLSKMEQRLAALEEQLSNERRLPV